MKILAIFTTLFILFAGGCTQQLEVGTVSPQALGYELSYETGTVLSVKPVIIRDNGNGTFLGMMTGAILGSMVGKGRGNTLATLGGGLVGMYAGAAAGQSNALELTVKLDSGRDVVVLVKGTNFFPGQRIRIVKRNGRVFNVEPI